MHKILIIAATCLSLAACTTTQQGATVGALGGAVVGGVATGNVVGAAVGAGIGGVVGAAAGQLLGRVEGSNNMCIYRASNGRTYRDLCPQG